MPSGSVLSPDLPLIDLVFFCECGSAALEVPHTSKALWPAPMSDLRPMVRERHPANAQIVQAQGNVAIGKHHVVQVIREPGLLSEEARHRKVPGLFLAQRVLGSGNTVGVRRHTVELVSNAVAEN